MKIRIKFRKYGVMKFIGHLDMMRYFQKAMRRAEIDIAYSEGFSPHQIMSLRHRWELESPVMENILILKYILPEVQLNPLRL